MSSQQSDSDYDTLGYCNSLCGGSSSFRQDTGRYSSRGMLKENLAQHLKETKIVNEKQLHNGGININCISEPQKSTKINTTFHNLRFLVVIMGGFAYGLMIALRYNISVAILSMVNQEALFMDMHPNSTIEEFFEQGYSLGGDFDWDNEIQQLIMSCYMITYTLPQVFTTKLGLKMGVRYAIPISLTMCSLVTILTPLAAYKGDWEWVLVLRLVNGLGASAVLPLALNLIQLWMPEDEIFLGLTVSKLVYALMSAGTSIFTGYLCSIHWVYSFYITGAIGIIFSFIWALTITKPEECKLLSEQELKLINGVRNEEQLKSSQKIKEVEQSERLTEKPSQGRLMDVFFIPSFYAILIMWTCHNCSLINFNFILPTYLRQFLLIKVSENGLYCTLINLGSILAILWPNNTLKLLKERYYMSNTSACRAIMFMVCVGTSSTWFYIGLFHENQLIMFFINQCFHLGADIVGTCVIMSAFSRTGISSVVFGLVNTIGNVTVVLVSSMTGYVLDESGQSEFGWTSILWAMSLSHIIMMLVFCLFIRAEPVELKGQRELRIAHESMQNREKTPREVVVDIKPKTTQ